MTEHDEPILGKDTHYGRFVAIGIVLVLILITVVLWAMGALHSMGTITVTSSKHGSAGGAVSTETFVVSPNTVVQGSPTKTIATAPQNTFASPDHFKTFDYDATAGKQIIISGTCTDLYYTILVFTVNNDYRTNPRAAAVNRAFACPATRMFSTELNLADSNLTTGAYYLFVADQGKTGSWYNPR